MTIRTGSLFARRVIGERAERALGSLHLKLRGQAYSAAAILLGPRAPKHWRNLANQLLFIPERPYFAAVAVSRNLLQQPPVQPEDKPGVVRTPPRLL